MIKSRMEAIFIISIHTVQNIIGVIRFSYGFHRTGSPNTGLKLDVCLGTESFANVLTDAIVIFLLWREEKSLGLDVRPAQMTRVLGVFVAWNAIALHICAFGNLTGLLYPPKWYTNEDADALSTREKASGARNVHKRLLYEYYLFYRATKGKPFDYAALSRTAGSVSHPSVLLRGSQDIKPHENAQRDQRTSTSTAHRRPVPGSRQGASRSVLADQEDVIPLPTNAPDTAAATEMSQRYSRSSRMQSAVGENTTRSGARTLRTAALEDSTNTIQKTGTAGERSRRRPSVAADAEAGCTVIEEKADVKYQPLKHGASAGAPGATGKRRGSHARRHSVAEKDRSNVGAPKRSRRHSEQGRRLFVAPDGGVKAPREPGPLEGLP
ncbi:hypothetical protein MTO96_034405 [Rhipicephalus appendiculatus]